MVLSRKLEIFLLDFGLNQFMNLYRVLDGRIEGLLRYLLHFLQVGVEVDDSTVI